MNVQLNQDRILVEPAPAGEDKIGNLHLPNTQNMRTKMRFGTVVGAGPGRVSDELGFPPGAEDTIHDFTSNDLAPFVPEFRRKPMLCKVGDKVCFYEGAAQAVMLDGDHYVLMGDQDVQMVVGEDVDVNQVFLAPTK